VHERKEAKVEVRAVDEAARRRESEQLGRLLGRHRERLLADDVLARRERLLRLRVVQVVRRRQMDDVDGRVREQLLNRLVDGRDPLRSRSLRRRADDARDVDPQEAERVHVDDADEPRADDAGAERSEGSACHGAYATRDTEPCVPFTRLDVPSTLARGATRLVELMHRHRVPGATLGSVHDGAPHERRWDQGTSTTSSGGRSPGRPRGSRSPRELARRWQCLGPRRRRGAGRPRPRRRP
jgi:hypothetical protein